MSMEAGFELWLLEPGDTTLLLTPALYHCGFSEECFSGFLRGSSSGAREKQVSVDSESWEHLWKAASTRGLGLR